jgi:hypothetical protein
MNSLAQNRLNAEAGLLHPVESHFARCSTGSDDASYRHLALMICGAVSFVGDEREVELRNVAVLGYNQDSP